MEVSVAPALVSRNALVLMVTSFLFCVQHVFIDEWKSLSRSYKGRILVEWLTHVRQNNPKEPSELSG